MPTQQFINSKSIRDQASNAMKVGERIRGLRQQKGLTQVELGQLIGCAQTTVAQWERDPYRAPGKKLLGKVAEIFEVSTDYLLGVERLESSQIPCYGEVFSEEFLWPDKNKAGYYINVPQSAYSPNRFSLRVLDDLLFPLVDKGSYCIFDTSTPVDGDLAIIRFPENHNKAIIRMWRQQDKTIMLSETNLRKICPPYFFEIIRSRDGNLAYVGKQKMVVEGRVVAVKKVIKTENVSPRIKCFS